MFKGIIFDHDGTLIDSENQHYECWRELLHSYGIEFTLEEYIREHNGIPAIDNARVIISTYGLNVSPAVLTAEKSELTRRRFSEKPGLLMPFAEQIIRASFSRGYRLAVATCAEDWEVKQTLGTYNLKHYFSAVVTVGQVKRSKPAPDVYQLAVESIGLDRHQCVAIEDTETGLISAQRAGLKCIIVENKFSSGQNFSNAEFKCNNLSKALEWIESYNMQFKR